MSAAIVIPARYDSTRFPGKPLALLRDRPLLQHVYERSRRSALADDVMVATDSETIFEAVLSFGGNVVMTSPHHASGTDRVAEVARSLAQDIIINVQGDEPLIRPQMIDDVIRLFDDPGADMGTLAKHIEDPEEIRDPNVVKVVFGDERYALYFSRSPIPYHRETWRGIGLFPRSSSYAVYKHIGVYGYRREVLLKVAGLRPTRLEETEKLEQLRALEHGFRIKVQETSYDTMGVDTPQDMERVEQWLNSSS